MRKLFVVTLTAFLFVGFAPLIFANGYGYGFDYVEDGCDGNNDGTDVRTFSVDCEAYLGQCHVFADLCGDLDNKAKYRVHFDTQEPFFDDYDDCLTTSDDTAMYRPKSTAFNDGKLTGPHAYSTNMEDDYLSWHFDYEALGVSEGDTFAVWMDVHKKGIQDRAPDTMDDYDLCAKPQNMYEVLNIMIPYTNGNGD
jgi:hypothetical protein